MDRKRLLAIVSAAALVAAGIFAWRHMRGPAESGAIRLSGTVEATEVPVAFRIPGRVTGRHVDEGVRVTAGQPVATLDSRDLERETEIREAEVEAAGAALAELLAGSRRQDVGRAKAGLDRAQSRLRELESGSRPQEIEAAAAGVARAEAEAARQAKDFARIEALYRREAVSRRAFEAAQAGNVVAQARLDEARQQLLLVREGPRKESIDQARAVADEAAELLSAVREGPRREQIALAKAKLAQAKAALALAKSRLADAEILSPLSGIVLSKNVEPGDVVAAGTPVVTVAALENVWIRAYVPEADLGRLRLGQQARVTVDGLPGRDMPGRLSFIASEAEFTPKSVETRKERVRLVYRVKIEVANPDGSLKPGMPADAELAAAEAGEAPAGNDPRR